MALDVETGTGSASAESYVTADEANSYAVARGLTFPVDAGAPLEAAEQALRRATAWLDSTYRSRFNGYRKNRRAQALEWPRVGAYDAMCPPNAIEDDEVPVEVRHATIEAAVRELASPGALSPDVTVGKIKKSVRVEGAVSVEYSIGSGGVQDQRPVMTVVDGILAPLLGAKGNPIVAPAVRG